VAVRLKSLYGRVFFFATSNTFAAQPPTLLLAALATDVFVAKRAVGFRYAGTAAAVENYGGTHIDCDINGLCIDTDNKVVTSAACVSISVLTGSTCLVTLFLLFRRMYSACGLQLCFWPLARSSPNDLALMDCP
jgi:hypothetical protein